jgi:hypothetical protein
MAAAISHKNLVPSATLMSVLYQSATVNASLIEAPTLIAQLLPKLERKGRIGLRLFCGT